MLLKIISQGKFKILMIKSRKQIVLIPKIRALKFKMLIRMQFLLVLRVLVFVFRRKAIKIIVINKISILKTIN